MRTLLLSLHTGYKKKLLLIACVLVSTLSQATNWYVNDVFLPGDVFTTAMGSDANPGTQAAPYATIQFAIDNAVAGDFIYVDAGTYASVDINITKALTLRGAKFGIPAGPADVPPGRGTNESIIEASIFYAASTDNITVDGFTLNTGTALRGIVARGLNSVVINNILVGIVTPFSLQQGIATRASAPVRLHSYTISYNNVRGYRFGIYMDGALESPSEISYNYVTGASSSGYVFTASNGHHIKANVAENNTDGMSFTEGSNLIEQNTLNNNITSGITLVATPLTANNTILNNFITNNGIGINLTSDNAGAINNAAHFNSITGNTMSIVNNNSAVFDAQCNWYGTTVSAIIAAGISGSVIYIQYLTDGTDTDPVLDGFQHIATCGVVPVILRDFSAIVYNYDVRLKWQTASEVNSSHFIIERSPDGNHFEEIGRLAAKGFSDVVSDYFFTDNKPGNFNRPTFFRLVMVDRDGTFKYSRIISVVLKLNGLLQVYPNPVYAGNVIHAKIVSLAAQNGNVSFVNSIGQVINKQLMHLNNGVNVVDVLSPKGITPGLYFMLIKTSDNTEKIPIRIN